MVSQPRLRCAECLFFTDLTPSQGSIISAIGRAIEAVISAIASVIMAIIGGITMVSLSSHPILYRINMLTLPMFTLLRSYSPSGTSSLISSAADAVRAGGHAQRAEQAWAQEPALAVGGDSKSFVR